MLVVLGAALVQAGGDHWVVSTAGTNGVRTRRRTDTIKHMHVARVKNGRLTLDEPTGLPDSVVPLEIADGDDLDDVERAELHESLRESIEQLKAGETISVEQALAELRAHR
jgi:hypothetical protein